MENDVLKLDLHLHTNNSDGRLDPQELIKKCQELGLEVVAITDHESVKGVPDALEAGRELGVIVIPGIELTGDFEGVEQHILGYFIDFQGKKLKEFLESGRRTKNKQIKKMVEKLQGFGLAITFEEVILRVKDHANRSHIGDAVFSHPQNLELLKKKKIETQHEFFKAFLKEDGEAFADRERLSVRKIIDLIASIGGVSVLAHPFWKKDTLKELERKISILQKFGLDGLEVGYPWHDEERVKALHRIAEDFSLYESAGSDFHAFEFEVLGKIANFELFGIELNLDWLKRRIEEK